jgi:hypothetical protein
MTNQKVTALVEELMSKAMYKLECDLVAKFGVDSFDAYIDGAEYNKAFNKIVKMYALAAEKELDKSKV